MFSLLMLYGNLTHYVEITQEKEMFSIHQVCDLILTMMCLGTLILDHIENLLKTY